MMVFFRTWLNACRVETTKNIISTDITIELNLFVFKSLFKINDKINISTPQVTFPLLLMLTLDKKLSFIHSLAEKMKPLKLEIKLSIMTLIIKGHGGCKSNWFLKFHKSRINIIVITNFIRSNLLWDLLVKIK